MPASPPRCCSPNGDSRNRRKISSRRPRPPGLRTVVSFSSDGFGRPAEFRSRWVISRSRDRTREEHVQPRLRLRNSRRIRAAVTGRSLQQSSTHASPSTPQIRARLHPTRETVPVNDESCSDGLYFTTPEPNSRFDAGPVIVATSPAHAVLATARPWSMNPRQYLILLRVNGNEAIRTVGRISAA